MNRNTPEFISTAAAAQMLGLSTTMVQSLVDKNELQGWKTQGGHRRISMQSIQNYKVNSRIPSPTTDRGSGAPKVMVVLESHVMSAQLRQQSLQWGFPLDLQFMDSITEALLLLGGQRPDLLVVELNLPLDQQQRTIQALENFNARGRPVSMVLVSNETNGHPALIQAGGAIQVVSGPLSVLWLHAYLTGVSATCRT